MKPMNSSPSTAFMLNHDWSKNQLYADPLATWQKYPSMIQCSTIRIQLAERNPNHPKPIHPSMKIQEKPKIEVDLKKHNRTTKHDQTIRAPRAPRAGFILESGYHSELQAARIMQQAGLNLDGWWFDWFQRLLKATKILPKAVYTR